MSSSPVRQPAAPGGQRDPSWAQFVAWAAAALLVVAGLGAAFTPLIVIVGPAAGLVVGLLIYRCGANRSVLGLACGAALIPLGIAYLNRGGPGTVCNSTNTSCTQEWSPWPFLSVGLLLLVGGVACFAILGHWLSTRAGR
jgi:hypothetical protein